MNIRTRLNAFPIKTVAVVDGKKEYPYSVLVLMMDMMSREKYRTGGLYTVCGEPNIFGIAKFLALLDSRAIAVLMDAPISPIIYKADMAPYEQIRKRHRPGFVLFEHSGKKPVIYDFEDFSEPWFIYDTEAWQRKDDSGSITIKDTPSWSSLFVYDLFDMLFNGGKIILRNE